MCDKAIDSYLLALNMVPEWFVTSQMIEKVDSAVLPNDYIAFEDLDSDFFAFFSRYIGLNSIDLNNINLDYDHSDYCDPETINYVKIMTWHKHTKKAPKKNIYEKLLPVAWHPTR